MSPTEQTIGFIGGGNMARSLVVGLVASGTTPGSIFVAEPVPALRDALHDDFGVHVFADAHSTAMRSATWVLAIKPQAMREACELLAAIAQRDRPLVVSIAAGITTRQLDRWLGGDVAIVRAMPNTPALLGAGITGLYANPQVGADGCRRAERLLSNAGETVWLMDEAKMDAVTAVSGSGPAYVFLLAESMHEAALSEGLPADVARMLVLQTILGAARMLTEEDATPTELRRRVTTPGGTTQAAVETLVGAGFGDIVQRAINAAAQRSRKLSSMIE